MVNRGDEVVLGAVVGFDVGDFGKEAVGNKDAVVDVGVDCEGAPRVGVGVGGLELPWDDGADVVDDFDGALPDGGLVEGGIDTTVGAVGNLGTVGDDAVIGVKAAGDAV